MNRLISFTAALTLSLVSLPATFAHVDESSGSASDTSTLFRETPKIDRFIFEGGSVVEYVELIREKMPQANFVLMPGAESFAMPPMELRNITLGEAAELISRISASPNNFSSINTRRVGEIYAIQVNINQPSRPQMRPPVPLVVSIADVVNDDMTAEDVLTSIETSLNVFGDTYPQAKLLYHEATKMLVARGHTQQVEQIQAVISQLRASSAALASRAERNTISMSQYLQDIEELELLVKERERRVEHLIAEVLTLRERIQELEQRQP